MYKYNILLIIFLFILMWCSQTPETDVSQAELEQEVQNVLEVE
jgi:hypothetical protein